MNPEEKIAREVAMSFADVIGIASIRAAKSALKQAKESETAKLAAILAAVTAERDRLRERVERLEEAGDNLDDRIACGCGVDGPCTSCRGASDAWTKAKEAKP
jgi:hypothetical protein